MNVVLVEGVIVEEALGKLEWKLVVEEVLEDGILVVVEIVVGCIVVLLLVAML